MSLNAEQREVAGKHMMDLFFRGSIEKVKNLLREYKERDPEFFAYFLQYAHFFHLADIGTVRRKMENLDPPSNSNGILSLMQMNVPSGASDTVDLLKFLITEMGVDMYTESWNGNYAFLSNRYCAQLIPMLHELGFDFNGLNRDGLTIPMMCIRPTWDMRDDIFPALQKVGCDFTALNSNGINILTFILLRSRQLDVGRSLQVYARLIEWLISIGGVKWQTDDELPKGGSSWSDLWRNMMDESVSLTDYALRENWNVPIPEWIGDTPFAFWYAKKVFTVGNKSEANNRLERAYARGIDFSVYDKDGISLLLDFMDFQGGYYFPLMVYFYSLVGIPFDQNIVAPGGGTILHQFIDSLADFYSDGYKERFRYGDPKIVLNMLFTGVGEAANAPDDQGRTCADLFADMQISRIRFVANHLYDEDADEIVFDSNKEFKKVVETGYDRGMPVIIKEEGNQHWKLRKGVQ